MKHLKSATVRALRNGYFIEAQSGYRLMFSDPEAFHRFVQPEIDNHELGHLIVLALDASRLMALEEAKERMNSSSIWEAWVEKMMSYVGVSTQQKLFQKMAVCHIKEAEDLITFLPTVKRRGAAWEGRGDEFKVSVRRSDGPAAIGLALRASLDKCVPQLGA